MNDTSAIAPVAASATPAKTPSPTAMEIGAGMVALQEWLLELRRSKLIEVDADGILFIHAQVAQRFALAFVGGVVLLAMPPLETVWARIVPWDYAAIYRGRKVLHLIGETMELDGAPVPPLAVSFTVAEEAKALALQRHSVLELRGFAGNLKGNWQVSPRPFATLPVHVLDEDENVMDLLEQRPRNKARAGY